MKIRNKLSVFVSFFLLVVTITGCSSLGIRSVSPEDLQKKYHISDNDFITIDGTRVHYRDEGAGPPLLLLHGICASLFTWDGWNEHLKDKYRVIRLDVPGWGLTGSVGKDAYDIEKMCIFLEKFLAELKIDSCYIAGNSLGGYFAWNYALRHPEQVKKMILLDPVAYPQKVPWFISAAKIPVVRAFPKMMMPKFLISMNVKAVYSDDSKITNELVDLYFDMSMREGNRSSYIDIFRFMAKHCQKESLSTGICDIQTETLLMYGRDDKWISPEQGKLWKKDLPGVRQVVYDGVGHVPMEELPKETALDADRFFSETSENVVIGDL